MNPPKVVLFTGTTGSGKSWALGKALKFDRVRPQVILTRWPDPSLLRHISPKMRTVERWRGGYIRLPSKGRYMLLITPLPAKELRAFQRDLATAFTYLPRGVLAIDEAHIILRRGTVHPELVRLLRGARHYGTSVYLSTQRVTDIDPDIRSVVTDLFAFRTVSSVDLAWLEAEGVPPHTLSTLPTGEYIYLSKLSGRIIRGRA